MRSLSRAREAPPSRLVRGSRRQVDRHAALVAHRRSLLASLALAEIPLAERRSGYDQMSPATKAMQDDDTSNPATLSVLDGEALWKRKAGARTRPARIATAMPRPRCAASRRAIRRSARERPRPINIEQRINLCRTEQQKAPPLRAMRAATCWRSPPIVGQQSRGMPIAVTDDEKTRPFIEAGRKLYSTRQGQLNLSCQNCHDDNWGQKLAGVPLVQGHPNGYPLYRLEWQSLGSLQRRLRNCLIGMRAEPYAYGADEYVDLELFLMWRARGMTVETPAVRP